MFGQKYTGEESAGSGSGNEHWIKRFPSKKDTLTVRVFTNDLGDTSQVITYREVFDRSINRGWPLHDGERFEIEEGDEDVVKVNYKQLVTVLNVDEDRVWAFAPPKAFIDFLEARMKLKGKINDTDFVISKTGTGLDTKYAVMEGETYEIDTGKYRMPDLESVLGHARQHAEEEGHCLAYEGATEAPAKTPPKEKAAAPAPEEAPPVEKAEPETLPGSNIPAGGDMSAGLPEDWRDHTISKIRSYAKERGITPSGMSKGEIIAAIEGSDAL
jgi:hypothetical protein